MGADAKAWVAAIKKTCEAVSKFDKAFLNRRRGAKSYHHAGSYRRRLVGGDINRLMQTERQGTVHAQSDNWFERFFGLEEQTLSLFKDGLALGFEMNEILNALVSDIEIAMTKFSYMQDVVTQPGLKY